MDKSTLGWGRGTVRRCLFIFFGIGAVPFISQTDLYALLVARGVGTRLGTVGRVESPVGHL